MSTFFENDYAIQFFKDHGYPTEYNDGMLAWLRDVYGTTDYTLPDLLSRYIREYGKDFNMRVLGKSAIKLSLVEPAATFTVVTPSSAAGGADTLLTSAGVHGLTSAVSVGASIYISAGTGWTVGFHTITAIAVDTTGTTIQIDTPFDAGMGTPTIALANTEVTMLSSTVPILGTNSVIRSDYSSSCSDNTGTAKTIRVYLNTTLFSNLTITTSPFSRRITVIHNRNSTSSQVGGFASTVSTSDGNTTVAQPTGSVDTSVETFLNITFQPAAANIVMNLERYLIELFV